jgi:hypothetical protein
MDAGLIEWIVGQTGTAAVAAIALWQLNRAYTDAIRREKDNTDTHRQDKQALLTALSDNAKALAALEAACERITDKR